MELRKIAYDVPTQVNGAVAVTCGNPGAPSKRWEVRIRLLLLEIRPHIHLIPIELAVWRENPVVAGGDLQPLSYRILIAEDKSASLVAPATPPRHHDFIR